MPRFLNFGIGLFLISFAAGCGGSGPPIDDSILPGPGEPVSFSQHIQPIFNSSCTNCHVRGGVSGLDTLRLYLEDGESWTSLVNQASTQSSALTRVIPNDSANSLLYQKVSSDTPPVGSRMPIFGGSLSQKQIDVIKAWIDQGALDN